LSRSPNPRRRRAPAPRPASRRSKRTPQTDFRAPVQRKEGITARRATTRPEPAPEPGAAIRLQKLLAAAGLGSRREIESWIVAGRLTVAGRKAQLGQRVSRTDAIALDGRPIALAASSGSVRVLAYHKPAGEIVSRSDPGERASVFDRLPPLAGAKWTAIGRLDLNTSGLLLFTDSGELANRLMHPRYGLEREYAVRVRGAIDEARRQRLLAGIRLEDGVASFASIEELGHGRQEAANRWYRVTLKEGRYREVRRLLEAVDRPVSRLIRTRFGPISLPRDLAPGTWRELLAAEIGLLSGAARAG
jgi:23S rRNA pseudouridine2605 synthase